MENQDDKLFRGGTSVFWAGFMSALSVSVVTGVTGYVLGNSNGRREATQEITSYVTKHLNEEESGLVSKRLNFVFTPKSDRTFEGGLEMGQESLIRIRNGINARYKEFIIALKN